MTAPSPGRSEDDQDPDDRVASERDRLNRFPDLDEAKLTAWIEQGNATLRAVGLDAVSCRAGTDPDETEKAVRERLPEEPSGVVMIGGGVRMIPEHTLLFERLINVLAATTPGIRLYFDTSPETTIDAIRRWA